MPAMTTTGTQCSTARRGSASLPLHSIAKYQFPLLKGFFRKESEVKGTILTEVFDAGDYYADAETGYFLRFELAALF